MPPSDYSDRIQYAAVLYVDVYAYHTDADGLTQYLLLKRRGDVPMPETWQGISGKLLHGERISDAFHRQVLRKTGQEPELLFKIDCVSTFYDQDYDLVMLVPAAACRLPALSVVIDRTLHDTAEWVSYEEACRRVAWDSQRKALGLLNEMTSNPSYISSLLSINPHRSQQSHH
jgi:ADP-ribose pyrophosphatase YjhB (NUDIX family)